ncbi:PilW family protein [Amphibiibacter pelophylacis]|uniref:Prepilin-type N-terminal cleavage/methylation domain-containing protein n=1 Tax=Amphibiibacter pelophylacis TaxID=1799477 RepID=A0ACC6NYL9_9BURK
MKMSSPLFHRRQRGLTLVEVMVGLALGLIVVGAILSTYLTVARSQVTQLGESQLSQNSGSAMGFIGSAVRDAGLTVPDTNWNDFNQDLRVQPPGGTFDLFGARNKNPSAGNKPWPSIQMITSGGVSTLVVRREIDPDNSADLDCLGRPYPKVAGGRAWGIVECRFNFDTTKRDLTVQAVGLASPITAAAPLVPAGTLFDYQIRTAQQPAGNFYSATPVRGDISYFDATDATDWPLVVGVELCLVLASPTDPAARPTSYTRCDGSTATAPTTGPAYAFRIVRSTFQLRNRSAVMPFLNPDPA